VWLGFAAAMVLPAACSGGDKDPTLSPRREITNRYNMARVYLNQGRALDAIPLLEEVIEKEPRHAEAHNLLGVVFWTLGQPEKAQAILERALEISPYLSDARVNLGVLFSEGGDYERARQEFERALKDRNYATPEKPLVNLAVNDIKQGRPREALVQAEKAIRHNPLYARAYGVFVEALRKADPKVAGVEYRTLVRALDGSQDFHLNLGNAFLEKQDRKRARYHLEKVVDLNPSNEQAGQARKNLETLR
jgi:superkiller protein 3